MAYASWKDISYVLVGGYDIRATVAELGVATHCVRDTFHPAGEVFPVNIDTGKRNGELTVSCKLNSTTTDPISAVSGTGVPVQVLHEGNTLPARMWAFQSALVTDVEPSVEAEKAHDLAPSFGISGAIDYGHLVAPYVARTTAGNTQSTYADLGAAAASGGRAYLNICSIDVGGGSGVTVTLQHSTNHVDWSDYGTPFTIAAAVGAQCLSIATGIGQYLAIKWAWTGGSDQTFSGAVSFAPA